MEQKENNLKHFFPTVTHLAHKLSRDMKLFIFIFSFICSPITSDQLSISLLLFPSNVCAGSLLIGIVFAPEGELNRLLCNRSHHQACPSTEITQDRNHSAPMMLR